MQILLDECLPVRLRRELPGHVVNSVSELGWSGIRNGTLLKRMAEHRFAVLITADQNISHQQNFQIAGVAAVILIGTTNRLADLLPLMPAALRALTGIQPGDVIRIGV